MEMLSYITGIATHVHRHQIGSYVHLNVFNFIEPFYKRNVGVVVAVFLLVFF